MMTEEEYYNIVKTPEIDNLINVAFKKGYFTCIERLNNIDENTLDKLASEYIETICVDNNIIERFQDKITLIELLKDFYKKVIRS